MEGSEAMAEAAVASGCRFFAGYPMTPFTEILEHFARKLPEVGGVCINAESELEAVGMAWGALATGARAATGSTGQGLALMQESFSEITLAELPLVIFDMARGQGDYFQATRGGGHGDYRHIVLSPIDITEAVVLTQLAFELADRWRNPALILGDYLLAHTSEAVDVASLAGGPAASSRAQKDWAVDGSLGGTGRSRIVSSLGIAKVSPSGPVLPPGATAIEAHLNAISGKLRRIEASEVRVETGWLEGADHVVMAFGTVAKFVRYVVAQLRADGVPIGYVRPVTLWPFPYTAVAEAAADKKTVMVFEINAGQMIDDVRIGVAGRAPVVPIGGISTDGSGFGVGALLDIDIIRGRIEQVVRDQEVVA
jgi:2-oxoglutarate ferredoxin oxidoreductase subunit alpha